MFEPRMNPKFTDDIMMASLFANATEGILFSNRSGEIVLVNPCAEKMFGYSKEEMQGQRIEILLPEDIRSKHVHHREGFHQHPVNRSMGAGRDLFAKRKDGSVFPVEISLSHYKLGEESFVIAFIIDITVRKQHEEVLQKQKEELQQITDEVKKLNADLEQKVEDRTMMLRETLAQLESSKEDLERALLREKELSDLKSRFVSTVSHEFRTPLSTVLSSAALLSKYKSGDEQDKRDRHVTRIKESVKHLSAMLEDLLSLGKLEEGLVQAKREEFPFAEFMQNFVTEMQEVAGKNLKIILSQKGGKNVLTDKRLLKNILLNLVSNAIKFSHDGGEINLVADNKDGYILVEVRDNGIGISKEDQDHLFERFFRARNAQNIQGTGLGLHIVSKYLELLNGKIELKSAIDKGTSFTIIIPSK